MALGRTATGATGAAGHAEANGALIADRTGGCSCLDDEVLVVAAGAPETTGAAAGTTTGALIADPTEDCSRVDDVALGGAARAAGGGAAEG